MFAMDNKARRTSPQPSWLEAFLLVLFTFLVLMFAAARSHGAPPPAVSEVHGLDALGAPTDIQHAGGGELLLRTASPGLYLPAPTVGTDVELSVHGFVDRARVRQRFHNPTSAWVEGVYVFPLPDGAAVDTLRMKIGERVIEGDIQEREEAKKTYETAKAEGRKASLVEQERPNVFTTSIANLGPGEDLEVEIEYQEELRYDDGTYELRFPMVVAPRYIPGAATGGPRGLGWSPNTTAVADASRLTPPVAPAGAVVNPVRLRVALDAGFALASVTSPSHRLAVGPQGTSGAEQRGVLVTLADGEVPADRDFVLRWRLAGSAAPRAAVFTEERPEGTYVLAMVVPPLGVEAASAPSATVAREEIFVVDTSGSMAGASLAQAKASLRFALSTLRPQDRFNVIQFNSAASRLFDAPEMAFPDTVQKALDYVDQLEANGGTEMRAALELALGEPQAAGAPLRQVVFMTDGSVGNESELFAYIHQHLGETRLFTVGIGSAPNAHFLRRAAEFGRGSFTSVSGPQEVEARIGGLFRKLGNPALTDLELTFDDLVAEAWPARLPDVYLGEPVTVAVRLAKRGGEVRLRGLHGTAPWHRALALGVAPASPTTSLDGIEKLWARRKIAALMDAEIEGRDAATVRADVTAVALEHHLVSQFTSLVAVEVTPGAPPNAARTVLLPVSLPAGWVYEDVWGTMPATATPRDLLLLAALLFGGLAFTLWRCASPRRSSPWGRW